MRFILVFAALLLFSLPVAGQQKYSTWANPDAASGTTKELVDKLNSLIEEAEKSRAADPVFLRDLRALTQSYDVPSSISVLRDDFSDGDFAANPVWTVSAGRFWIEKDWGLRSAITPGAEAAPAQQTKKASGKDLALALFGAVLQQAAKSKSEPAESEPASPQVASIHSAVAIANAFSIEFVFSSWQPKGRFDLGPYQGTDTNSGYRLSYTPGGELKLLKVTSRGSSVIKQATFAVPLEDEKPHTILWSRDKYAKMTITIDGKTVLSTTDRSFSDPFQGIAISNHGGDYIIKQIAISGAS
jgi:hypothetical protein